jgi:hypothetical protein
LLSWLGTMSTRNAMLALAAGTLLGIAVTLVAGSEPGFLLGFFIIVGAIVATLGVRRGAVYLFFPLPPFAFFVGAVITGKVHDSSISSTTVGLSATLLQWIAGIFFPMCVAIVCVLLIGGARWALDRQLVGGQFPMSANRQPSPVSPRPRTPGGPRPGTDPWADPRADPRAAGTGPAERPGSAPRLGPDGARIARPDRDARDPRDERDARDPRDTRGQRDERDPWVDPRAAADRRPPNRNAPPASSPQPRFQPRPASPVQPADRAPRPPAPPRPGRPPGDYRDGNYPDGNYRDGNYRDQGY